MDPFRPNPLAGSIGGQIKNNNLTGGYDSYNKGPFTGNSLNGPIGNQVANNINLIKPIETFPKTKLW